MKPRNKFQRKILKLSQGLSPLSEYQRKDAIRKVAPHIAKYNSKKQYVCLDCGHSWIGAEADKVVCPHCVAKLKVDKTRTWNFCDKSYFAIITKCQGFQVIRMFFMQTNLRRGEKATYWIMEAFQRWLTPDGKCAIVSRARHWFAHYCDYWNWDSDMEIREENVGHKVTPWRLIGQSSVIPEIKRNGFDGNYHRCSPYNLFFNLLTNNRIETLWKVGQYKLAIYAIGNSYIFDKHWASIKVVLRHKYQISDPSLWFDLIGALDYLDKDIRNPKWICPENLKEAHDEWQAKKEAKLEHVRRRRERERALSIEQRYLEDQKNVAKEEAEYQKAKSKFFDLKFFDNEIVIKPLVSVREVLDEGHQMHHCVFTNKYYKDENVLLFHALIDGTSIATIEFSLENFTVVQCRGVYNKVPQHYERIMMLMQKNTMKIMSKAA